MNVSGFSMNASLQTVIPPITGIGAPLRIYAPVSFTKRSIYALGSRMNSTYSLFTFTVYATFARTSD